MVATLLLLMICLLRLWKKFASLNLRPNLPPSSPRITRSSTTFIGSRTSMLSQMTSLPSSMVCAISFTLLFWRIYPRASTKNSLPTSTRRRKSSCCFWETEKIIPRINKRSNASSKARRKTKPRKKVGSSSRFTFNFFKTSGQTFLTSSRP